MLGRAKRRQVERQLLQAAASDSEAAGDAACALCGRALGTRVQWHHVVPKCKGGRSTVPVHPICHRTIHAHISNHELATAYAELDAVREHAAIARFLRWVAAKPADFNAPTRPARA